MDRRHTRLSKKDTILLTSIISLWFLLIFSGIYFLLIFENRPGVEGPPPKTWPSGLVLKRDPNRFTLVMLVHPKCSCSRATLGELSGIMSRFSDRLNAHVLFVVPSNADSDWKNSPTWSAAKAIKSVHAVEDVDGEIARKFNAETSGYALLYDTSGKLLFNGGITASRGHWGDNTGTQAITAFLEGRIENVHSTSVFGCELFNRKRGRSDAI